MERERERKGFRGLSTAAAASSCNAAATFDMTEEESARYAVYKGQEEIVRINFNWFSVPIFLQIYEENMLRHENILKFVAADNLGWTPFLINNFKYLKL